MFYENVFRKLNKNNVRYLVAGGVALNLHGIPRMTADLDLMLDLEKPNLIAFMKSIEKLGLKPRQPVSKATLFAPDKRNRLKKRKNMIMMTYYNPKKPYQEVDIFIENPIDFNEADSVKKVIEAGDLMIPVISIPHLIKMKRIGNRKQDKSDIEALIKVRKLKKL